MSKSTAKRIKELEASISRVKHLDGRPINWTRPPKSSEKVQWFKRDQYGRRVTGSFRTICHLDRLDRLAVAKYGKGIVIIQPAYNSSVKASEGTHDYDVAIDAYIPGVSWWEQQRFFRANGCWAWYRFPPKFSNHIHFGCLPQQKGRTRSEDYRAGGYKVGKYIDGGFSTFGRKVASSQIEDYYAKALGLSGLHAPGVDKSWFPRDIKATIFNRTNFCKRRAAQVRRLAKLKGGK